MYVRKLELEDWINDQWMTRRGAIRAGIRVNEGGGRAGYRELFFMLKSSTHNNQACLSAYSQHMQPPTAQTRTNAQ